MWARPGRALACPPALRTLSQARWNEVDVAVKVLISHGEAVGGGTPGPLSSAGGSGGHTAAQPGAWVSRRQMPRPALGSDALPSLPRLPADDMGRSGGLELPEKTMRELQAVRGLHGWPAVQAQPERCAAEQS